MKKIYINSFVIGILCFSQFGMSVTCENLFSQDIKIKWQPLMETNSKAQQLDFISRLFDLQNILSISDYYVEGLLKYVQSNHSYSYEVRAAALFQWIKFRILLNKDIGIAVLEKAIFEFSVAERKKVISDIKDDYGNTVVNAENRKQFIQKVNKDTLLSASFTNFHTDISKAFESELGFLLDKVYMLSQAGYKDRAVFNQLLKIVGDVNAIDREGKTALMWAVQSYKGHINEGVTMVSWLISAGADLNKRDKKGNTALLWAIMDDSFRYPLLEHNTDMVSLLLKAGADVNIGNNTDETPLMWSSKLKTPNVLQMLIKSGADVSIVKRGGFEVINPQHNQMVVRESLWVHSVYPADPIRADKFEEVLKPLVDPQKEARGTWSRYF